MIFLFALLNIHITRYCS